MTTKPTRSEEPEVMCHVCADRPATRFVSYRAVTSVAPTRRTCLVRLNLCHECRGMVRGEILSERGVA